VKYVEKEGLTDEDDLWFVMDKDRWSDEQLRKIAEYCDHYPNWGAGQIFNLPRTDDFSRRGKVPSHLTAKVVSTVAFQNKIKNLSCTPELAHCHQ